MKRKHNQQLKRDQIWNALIILLENRPIEKISIQNICDTAKIHRTTFYNHFYDIYDLLGYGTEQMVSGLIPEDILEFNTDAMSANITHYISRYRNVLANITRAGLKDHLLSITDEAFENYLYKTIAAAKDAYSLNIPIHVTAKFYCAGLSQLLYWWVSNRDMSEEELKSQVDEIIQLIKHSCIK
ncbi:hypothetical protein [Lacrimispora sp. 38-1]|uniref:hypothetical protein n=1 Tax=Lacrimispora sp. 38-1 TaxID=3125778 RepID=UPI003CF8C4CB